MNATPLPNAMQVRDLLEGMLGRDVDVTVGGTHVDPSGAPGAMVAVYTDDSLKLRALSVLDLPLAAYVGAAIALVPPGGAQAAVEDGELPGSIADNVAEVLNVTASLFNADGAPHLRLYSTYAPGDPIPADVAQTATGYLPRIDLDVTVKGYGAGQLSVVVP